MRVGSLATLALLLAAGLAASPAQAATPSRCYPLPDGGLEEACYGLMQCVQGQYDCRRDVNLCGDVGVEVILFNFESGCVEAGPVRVSDCGGAGTQATVKTVTTPCVDPSATHAEACGVNGVSATVNGVPLGCTEAGPVSAAPCGTAGIDVQVRDVDPPCLDAATAPGLVSVRGCGTGGKRVFVAGRDSGCVDPHNYVYPKTTTAQDNGTAVRTTRVCVQRNNPLATQCRAELVAQTTKAFDLAVPSTGPAGAASVRVDTGHLSVAVGGDRIVRQLVPVASVNGVPNGSSFDQAAGPVSLSFAPAGVVTEYAIGTGDVPVGSVWTGSLRVYSGTTLVGEYPYAEFVPA